MTDPFLIVAIGAALAGFVQGLSGFAFGLVAVSVWAWALDPVTIGPLVVFGSLIGQILGSLNMFRSMSIKRALPFVAGGLLGVPIGAALLRYIDPRAFKLGVGVLLIVWCPTMLFTRNLPRIVWGGRPAEAVAGWIGGIMGGLGGLTGPAPILWTTLTGMDRQTQRSVFMVYNIAMHTMTLTVYLASGTVPRAALPLFALMVPAMLLPSLAGVWVYHRISDVSFQRVILTVLSLSGAILVATNL